MKTEDYKSMLGAAPTHIVDDPKMVSVPKELLKTVLDPECTDDWAPACKQLRALLAGGDQ